MPAACSLRCPSAWGSRSPADRIPCSQGCLGVGGWRGTEASYPEPEGATANSKQVSCPVLSIWKRLLQPQVSLQMTDCRSRTPQVSPPPHP